MALLRRFVAARPALPHSDLGTQMAMFVQLQNVTPQSRLTYAKTLSAIATHVGWDVPMLRLYAGGLRRMGAAAPQHQAPPLSRNEVMTMLAAMLPSLQRVALWLAWKTASRWADIVPLRRRSFVVLRPDLLVVEWATTKTSNAGDFAAWRYTAVADPMPMTWVVTLLNTMGPDLPLTSLTTEQVSTLLRRHCPTRHYTAHSLKRGALDHLVKEVIAGHLDLRYVPLLAKHRDPGTQFPATTLRYISEKEALALAMGTQHATLLL
jgi:hypothetical protein